MKHKKGQSIIETVIAATLISVAVIAALSLINRSQKQNNYARQLAEAAKYNAQAADWIRTQRDTLGWSTIAAKASADAGGNLATYCFNTIPDTTQDFTDLSSGECAPATYIQNTLFTRHLIIDDSNVGSGILRISFSVTWQDNVEREAKIETELTQWN